MKWSAPRFFVLLLAVWCSSLAFAFDSAAAPGPVFRITGIVVSSVDETPIAHAHLIASLAARGRFFRENGPLSGVSTDADDRGRFELTLPSAGSWRLVAGATGFVTQAYEQHENYSSAIVLTPAEPTINLHFRLPPEAEITGTVLDEAGEAVRDARVTLQHRAAESPDGKREVFFQNRMTVQTDDRGVYEFANLAAGEYRILVDAKPWYSTSAQPVRISTSPDSAAALDPSLDVTYAPTWYPGVSDPEQAEIFSLKAADNIRADFHLVPIPAIHLQFATPTEQEGSGRRPVPFTPILERIDAGGGLPTGYGGTISNGQFETGGLSPGLYRVRVPAGDRSFHTSIIEITPGTSSRVLDASSLSTAVANISVNFDDQQKEPPYGVQLRDTTTGRRFTTFEGNMFLLARSRSNLSETKPQSMNLQVPPGRYEVTLMGRRDSYLTGLSVKGAQASGRFVTIPAGEVTLTLHTAEGFASVSGIATMEGKPIVGALVMLVPAGLDDPAAFTTLALDQTNTDGSFDLNNIIPGPYILIAVDRGWDIHWKDPSTLERYLTHGIPLDLHAHAILKQDISAQTP